MNETAWAYALFDTEVGRCGMAWGPQGLRAVMLPDPSEEATRGRLRRRLPEGGAESLLPPRHIRLAMERVQAVLEGVPGDDLQSLPLDWAGVAPFHRAVYEATRAIPPGQVRTYGQLAEQLGKPGSARAIGQALGANPYAPVVPCHRVLAAQGRAGGFSAPGGLQTKLRLLEIERAVLGDGPGLFD